MVPYLATKISSQNRLLCLSLRGRRQLGFRGRDPQRAGGLHQGQTGVTGPNRPVPAPSS